MDLTSHVFFHGLDMGGTLHTTTNSRLASEDRHRGAAVMGTASVYACECLGTPETVLAHNPFLLASRC